MKKIVRPSTAGSRPAPKSQAAKRESVLEAAAQVFCREGFAGASIDLIAAEAGVSRQTVYNHHREKDALFVAVVNDVIERMNASLFATLSTFPADGTTLEADLTAFVLRFSRNCICNRDGKFLRKLFQAEGERYPELFRSWQENGPCHVWPAIAARFARLAHAGALDIDDPDLAARQFLALVNCDLQMLTLLGEMPSDEQLEASARNAIRTFLRAYGSPPKAATEPRIATLVEQGMPEKIDS
ncbi:MAG: TetR/AcrR family transcriptional regulator C-terminal domain-containing protein [Phyllobacterium sp.]